ncbi:MAG TPA: C4-type zinc ribbon domain-containing protein [bacterium]|nr:C4-type zinc ribbon domain-containing protein [bacterium]HPQ66957.1 C4-type zinc ribbon domain-containing protein [bacterium]
MRDDLRQLLHLQSVDIRMSELEEEKRGLLSHLEMLDRRIAEQEAAARREKEACNQGQVTLKMLELKVSERKGQMQHHQQQSVNVRNNRDYQALMSEIEGCKADIRQIEDEMLEAMEQIEAERDELTRIEADLDRAREEFGAEKEKAGAEIESIDRELANLAAERVAAAAGMDGENLERYQRIYDNRKDRVVVPAVDGSCQGCYMQLTPQQANDVLKDDRLYFCENCGRFLYLPETEEEPGSES